MHISNRPRSKVCSLVGLFEVGWKLFEKRKKQGGGPRTVNISPLSLSGGRGVIILWKLTKLSWTYSIPASNTKLSSTEISMVYTIYPYTLCNKRSFQNILLIINLFMRCLLTLGMHKIGGGIWLKLHGHIQGGGSIGALSPCINICNPPRVWWKRRKTL